MTPEDQNAWLEEAEGRAANDWYGDTSAMVYADARRALAEIRTLQEACKLLAKMRGEAEDERDAWKERAERAEAEREIWRGRAEKHEELLGIARRDLSALKTQVEGVKK